MTGAFVGGEADFTTAFEPTGTALEKGGNGHIVASIGKDSGEIPYTSYSTTKKFMAENKDLLQRFTNAVYKGQLWIQTASDEEVAKAMQPFFTDISQDDLVSVVNRYKKVDVWSQDPVLKEESLNKLMEVMKEAKELDKEPPYRDIVNTNFANNAIKNVK